ncbi:hypothetical protein RHGRI_005789 [Rhododendron griersonianum]|uniref:Uncharacterized protein n=1 Tax=Rhododendron griersonianum TaxID=479676 RepID=A0AAV6LEP1_9ERIC|nr:hypothetical protein RHGRI_005789 [Rhododendron griersonianum]
MPFKQSTYPKLLSLHTSLMEETGITQSTKRIAVVTGSNKGIGLEICRQLASNGVTVILTARDENRGLEAVRNLKASGLSDILFHQLDVTNQTSIASLAEFIKTKFKKLDILVNNAGVGDFDSLVGPNAKKGEIFKQSLEDAEACLKTNYYGVKLLTEELIPLLQQSDSPKIVNVSSSFGKLEYVSNEKAKEQLSEIDGLTVEKVDEVVKWYYEDLREDLLETKGWPLSVSAYKVSKAALIGYTRVMAKNYPKIAINTVCPGYVKTDLNYNTGIYTVEQGAKGPVMLALLPHARDENRGLEAVRNLKASGLSDILFHQLDVTNQTSIASLAEFIKTKFKRLDILINNAGIVGTVVDPEDRHQYDLSVYLSNEKAKEKLSEIDGLTVEKVDEVVKWFYEDLREDLPETRGWPLHFSAYKVSKAALNGYTRVMAKNYPKIAINAVCPGYVKTDINYNLGIYTVEQGAKGPVMLALLSHGGPSGLFYSQTEVSTF